MTTTTRTICGATTTSGKPCGRAPSKGKDRCGWHQTATPPAVSLTKGVREIIVEALATGCYRATAAEHAGIARSTFYRWLELGQAHSRDGVESEHRALWEAIEKAEADAELSALATIRRAAPASWQAAAWLLERKHPDRWGRTQRVTLEGDEDRPLRVQPARILDGDYAEQVEKLLASIAGQREDTGGTT